MIGNPQLVVFDMDGTLRDYETGELLPGVEDFFIKDRTPERRYAIATNQGGVGLRHWMEKDGFGNPEDYPTPESIQTELASVVMQVSELADYGDGIPVYMAFAYQSKKSGKWSPDPRPVAGAADYRWEPAARKPGAMMLEKAMLDADVKPFDCLMVGDSDEDMLAAMAAGCNFQWAWEFFGWDNPNLLGGAV